MYKRYNIQRHLYKKPVSATFLAKPFCAYSGLSINQLWLYPCYDQRVLLPNVCIVPSLLKFQNNDSIDEHS